MDYLNNVWGSLKYNSTSAIPSDVSFRFLMKKDGNLVYVNNRAYKSVAVHVVKRAAMQVVANEVNNLFPRYKRYLENDLRKTVLKQQEANYKKLIEKGRSVDEDFGKIYTSEGTLIEATNKYGELMPDSLMMHYDTEDSRSVTVNAQAGAFEINTKTLVHIDPIASITMQSSKNLILTTVQGRDYSRKELVSGGDLTFSVSGKVVGNDRDVYPFNDVQKLIQMLEYGGVVRVHNIKFKSFNVTQVIVKEFSLGESNCKNEQPYTFSCVAVEPDEEVAVATDTIGVLNSEISVSPMNKWYKMILNNKLSSIIADTAANSVSSGLSTGIDALIPNI